MKLKNFDLFINPHSISNLNDNISNYDFISIFCLEKCSYVIYLVIPVINGEINGDGFILKDLSELMFHYTNNEVVIYAINYIDNISLKVV